MDKGSDAEAARKELEADGEGFLDDSAATDVEAVRREIEPILAHLRKGQLRLADSSDPVCNYVTCGEGVNWEHLALSVFHAMPAEALAVFLKENGTKFLERA
jgi:hypothetical protein